MAAVETPRLAKNYEMVYDIVRARGAGTHLTVAQVLAEAKTRQPGIGETTVYRALGRLRELGLVAEISLPGSDRAYYEMAAGAHAHFRCEGCGKVDDVPYMPSPQILDEIARRNGAQIAHVQLSLHGRCATCRDRAG